MYLNLSKRFKARLSEPSDAQRCIQNVIYVAFPLYQSISYEFSSYRHSDRDPGLSLSPMIVKILSNAGLASSKISLSFVVFSRVTVSVGARSGSIPIRTMTSALRSVYPSPLTSKVTSNRLVIVFSGRVDFGKRSMYSHTPRCSKTRGVISGFSQDSSSPY